MRRVGPLWAIIPVKPFALAKRRLASLLTDEERALLARTMLADVLAAIVAAPSVARVSIVTRDADAARDAAAAGAEVISSECDTDLNAALEDALRRGAARPRGTALIVPADVPAIEAADVEAIAALHNGGPAVSVARARDGGTNALACTPAGVIPMRFGPGSFRKHCLASITAGIAPSRLLLRRVALDVDCPHDIVALLAHGSATRTGAYLGTIDIRQRLVLLRQPDARVRP